MSDEFKIWYPVIVDVQLDFEKHEHKKDILCLGHILYQGRLMCGEAREAIKNRAKATKEKIVENRVERTKLCVECVRKYKLNGRSPYHAWVSGKPAPAPSKEVPVKY